MTTTAIGTVATTMGLRYTPLSLNEDMRFSTGTYTGGSGTIPVQTGTPMKNSFLTSRARTTAGTVLWDLKIDTSAAGAIGIWSNSVDMDQNVYSVFYTNSADRRFYNADTTLGATSSQALGGGSGVFLVKYNQNGKFEWYTRCDGTSGTADDTYGVWAESIENPLTGLYTSNVYNIFTYSGSGNVYSVSNQVTPAVVLTGASATIGDMGIAKFNSAGTVLWATRITSTAAELGRQVRGDGTGNVYAVGHYAGTVSIYSASNQAVAAATLTVITGRDIIIVKFDANGTYLWCAKMGNSTNTEFNNSCGVDSSGNIYLAGYYQSTGLQVWAAGGVAAAFTLPNTGSNDGYIVKYNFNGTVAWATKVSGPSPANDAPSSIATEPNGNCYIHGFTSGASLNIYSTTNYTTAVAQLSTFGAVQTGFIVKYNTAGTYIWSAKYGKATTATINSQNITVDKNGDIYGSGFYSDSSATFIDFYNQGGVASVGTLTSTANNDGYLWKYNSSGVYQWSARMTGVAGATNPTSLSVKNNALFVAGYTSTITGTLSIYNASGTAFANTLSTGTGTGFSWMAKYAY